MAIATEKIRNRRLKENGLILSAEYYDTQKKTRSSTDTIPVDVENGVLLRKTYLKSAGGEPVYTETEFNPCIHYTYHFPKSGDGMCSCPNCGFTAETKSFLEGCPYCGTDFNLDYDLEDGGSKYSADGTIRSIRNALLKKLPFIVLPILVAVMLIVVAMGRTHTAFDWLKGGGLGLICGLIVFLLYGRIEKKNLSEQEQEKLRQQQVCLKSFSNAFAAKGISMASYYYELAHCLEIHVFGEDDCVIDMDFMDFRDQSLKNGNDMPEPSCRVTIRRVCFREGMIRSYIGDYDIIMRYTGKDAHRPQGVITCSRCGASIHAETMKCDYCGFMQEYRPPYEPVSIVQAGTETEQEKA